MALSQTGLARSEIRIISKIDLRLLKGADQARIDSDVRDQVFRQLKDLNTSYIDVMTFHHHASDVAERIVELFPPLRLFVSQ